MSLTDLKIHLRLVREKRKKLKYDLHYHQMLNRLDIKSLRAGFKTCKSLGQQMALADAEIMECEAEVGRSKNERKKAKSGNAGGLPERQYRDWIIEPALDATGGVSDGGPDGVLDVELPSEKDGSVI